MAIRQRRLTETVAPSVGPSTDEPAKPVVWVEGVATIPDDEFLETAEEVTKERADLLHRLAQ